MSNRSVLRAGGTASVPLVPTIDCGSAEADSASGSGRQSKSRPVKTPSKTVAPLKVLQAFNTWAFKREQPSDPDLMLQIINDARALGEPIPFVLYWGKGPRG